LSSSLNPLYLSRGKERPGKKPSLSFFLSDVGQRRLCGKQDIQLNLTVYLYICYCLFMDKGSNVSKASRLPILAGELRVSVGKVIRRIREQAHPGDFTPAQKSVLHRMEQDGPITVSALARAESVRPQSMRVTVASLEKMGLVSGKQDPTDGRKTFFSLTATCRETLRSGRAVKEDWLTRAIEAQLTPREREQLAAALELIKRLADF
jgi:DNA-binding MarR family transcriptional regulator